MSTLLNSELRGGEYARVAPAAGELGNWDGHAAGPPAIVGAVEVVVRVSQLHKQGGISGCWACFLDRDCNALVDGDGADGIRIGSAVASRVLAKIESKCSRREIGGISRHDSRRAECSRRKRGRARHDFRGQWGNTFSDDGRHLQRIRRGASGRGAGGGLGTATYPGPGSGIAVKRTGCDVVVADHQPTRRGWHAPVARDAPSLDIFHASVGIGRRGDAIDGNREAVAAVRDPAGAQLAARLDREQVPGILDKPLAAASRKKAFRSRSATDVTIGGWIM
jgi:hypothetical protein